MTFVIFSSLGLKHVVMETPVNVYEMGIVWMHLAKSLDLARDEGLKKIVNFSDTYREKILVMSLRASVMNIKAVSI